MSNNQISDLSEFDKLIKNCNNTLKFKDLDLSNNSLDYFGLKNFDNVQAILNLKKAGVISIDISENSFANSPEFKNVDGIKTS